MAWFRRAQPPPPAEPTPFNAWSAPPLGSLGTEWDTRMDFPRDLAEDRRQEEDRRITEARIRKQQAGQINKGTLEIKRPWHSLTITGCCLLVCALSSTGPAFILMPGLALAAVVAALVAIHRIRNVTVFHRGVGLSISTAAMGLLVATLAGLRIAGVIPPLL